MRAIGRAWNRFWFTPQPTSTLALFRIALGCVALLWGLALLPDLRAFFSSKGIEPTPVAVTWGLLGHFTSDTVLYLAYAALLASAVCVVLGYRTRLASVVLFVTVFSFIQRTPSVMNSGDGLLRILLFLLMFMPAGESLSLDRWRMARDRFWEFPARTPWALRLVQIQVSLVYLSACYHKIDAGGWTNGEALSYAWRMDDIARFHVPAFAQHSLTVSTLFSFLTLAIELLIGVMVWVPSARPLVLSLGIALHIGIDLTLRIGFFSITIIVAYIAFLSPRTATRLILAARARIRRSSSTTVDDSIAAPGAATARDCLKGTSESFGLYRDKRV
ncbi:MAG: HTTM domain-containing protein [Acidimicrobiia bacterium]